MKPEKSESRIKLDKVILVILSTVFFMSFAIFMLHTLTSVNFGHVEDQKCPPPFSCVPMGAVLSNNNRIQIQQHSADISFVLFFIIAFMFLIKKYQRKKISAILIILLALGSSGSIYVYFKYAACKEEKRVYKLSKRYSKHFDFPNKSYPYFFYGGCSLKRFNKDDTFWAKWFCGITITTELPQQNLVKNENGTFNCPAIRKAINKEAKQ